MQLVDHVFILLLFVLQPIHGAFEARYYIARARAGHPAERVRFYRQTALMEWTILVLLAAAWFDFGRPVSDLGFVISGGPGFWSGAILCIAGIAYLFYLVARVRRRRVLPTRPSMQIHLAISSPSSRIQNVSSTTFTPYRSQPASSRRSYIEVL